MIKRRKKRYTYKLIGPYLDLPGIVKDIIIICNIRNCPKRQLLLKITLMKEFIHDLYKEY